ncbi:MAG TPA: tetratricopeptide repeat protein [Vicinamibacterales bacterium]|nr:tetratricopeptide repeat protein [Vicinamibacterales bacterium]
MQLRSATVFGLSVLISSTAAAQRSGVPVSPVAAVAVGQASAPSSSNTASKDWKRLSAAGFTAIGNAPAGELRRAALQLQWFQQTMRQLLGPLDLSSPVPTVLVVFRDGRAMEAFKPRDGRGRTRRNVAGYFMNEADVNYMVMATMLEDEWTLSVLFHEYTHYLVHRNMKHLPAWVNEGVAEFFSTFRMNTDGQATIGTVPSFRVDALREGRWLPLEKLLTNEGSAEALRKNADLYYAQSWGLVHYLLLNRARQGQLAAYLDALQDGKAVEPAFREAFHASVEQVETELRRYLRQFTLPVLKLPAPEGRTGSPQAETTDLREAEVLQLQGDLLTRTGAYSEAAGFLTKALALDPNDLTSQIAMACVQLRQDQPIEAVALLKKAVERAPSDFRAQYWLGVALIGAGRYKEALAALAAAVKINNASPGIWHEASVSAMALEDHRNAELAMSAVQRLDSDPSWFYARELRAFGLGRYDYAARDAEAYVREAGLGDETSPYASFMGALAYARTNDGEKARVLLRQVKASVAENSWQGVIARFLDAEIAAGDLLGRAEGNGQQTEAHAYIGIKAATEGRRDEALQHLQWVKDNGSRTYVEYAVAVAELKRLRP